MEEEWEEEEEEEERVAFKVATPRGNATLLLRKIID